MHSVAVLCDAPIRLSRDVGNLFLKRNQIARETTTHHSADYAEHL